MNRIQKNLIGNFIVEISPETMDRMGWKEGTAVYVGKLSGKDLLYIEEIPHEIQKKLMDDRTEKEAEKEEQQILEKGRNPVKEMAEV